MIPLAINGFYWGDLSYFSQLEQAIEMNNWYSRETLRNQHYNYNSCICFAKKIAFSDETSTFTQIIIVRAVL